MLERDFEELLNFEKLSFDPGEKNGPDYPGQYGHEGLTRWEHFRDRYGPALLTAVRAVILVGAAGLTIDALDGRIDGRLDFSLGFARPAEAAKPQGSNPTDSPDSFKIFLPFVSKETPNPVAPDCGGLPVSDIYGGQPEDRSSPCRKIEPPNWYQGLVCDEGWWESWDCRPGTPSDPGQPPWFCNVRVSCKQNGQE